MSMTYLLDTNVVSEPLRPAPNQKILNRLQQHQSEIAIASVVWHELLFGCHRLPPSAKRTAIEAYLRQVIVPTIPILPYDTRAAEWHAAEFTTVDGKVHYPNLPSEEIFTTPDPERVDGHVTATRPLEYVGSHITSLRNSLVYAGSAAIVCALFAVFLGYLIHRRNWSGSGVLDFVALTPAAVPGIFFGIGYALTFNEKWLDWIDRGAGGRCRFGAPGLAHFVAGVKPVPVIAPRLEAADLDVDAVPQFGPREGGPLQRDLPEGGVELLHRGREDLDDVRVERPGDAHHRVVRRDVAAARQPSFPERRAVWIGAGDRERVDGGGTARARELHDDARADPRWNDAVVHDRAASDALA